MTADGATVALCCVGYVTMWSSTGVGYTDEELLSFSLTLPWGNTWAVREALCTFGNRETRTEEQIGDSLCTCRLFRFNPGFSVSQNIILIILYLY